MNSPGKLVSLALATGMFAVAAYAADQERKSVCAVLPLDAGPGVHAGQAGLIANQYSVILDDTHRYDVLPRYDVNRVLHSRGFSRGKFSAALKKAVAAGKALNADYVVAGSVQKTDTGFALSTSLVSVNEARAAAAARSYRAGDFKTFSGNAALENVRLLLGIRELPRETRAAARPAKKPAVKARKRQIVVAQAPPEEPPHTAMKPATGETPALMRPERKPPVAPPRERVPKTPIEIAAIPKAPRPPEITTKPPDIGAIKPPEINPLPPLEKDLPKEPTVTVAPSPTAPPKVRPRSPVEPERTGKRRVRDLIIVPKEKAPVLPPAAKATPPKKATPVKVAAAKAPRKERPRKEDVAAAAPKKAPARRPVPRTDDSPSWTDTLAFACTDMAEAAKDKLDIGMRFNHYMFQTEEDDFIGSIDTIEADDQHIYERPLLDGWWPNGLYFLWRFSDELATELTYAELRAITLSHGGNHTDGTVVTAGPIITVLRRWPHTVWTPYAGLGLAIFFSTSVTGNNPWHNGFGGRDWDGYNAWAEAGAPPYPNGGYQRTFRVADELGYVLGLGLERKIGDRWSVDLNARYTYVVFENTYTLSFYGNQRGNARYSEWDLSNFNLGIGFKYSF